jgi:hypothetical protein
MTETVPPGANVAEANEDEPSRPRIDEVLTVQPLLKDDLYIGMQAMNLAIVDSMIEEMEDDLLAEYIHLERTPIDSVMAVSALSQLWIFGLYELLRTWRQRLQIVLKFADQTAILRDEDRESLIASKEKELTQPAEYRFGGPPHVGAFRKATLDVEYRDTLQTALDRSEIPFRRIEALRVHLAKHEVPKKSLYGVGAGYSRINYDGSIQYHVPLGGNEVDTITRRQIAADIRDLQNDRPLFILAPDLQKRVEKFKRLSYGTKGAVLVLNDGSQFESVIAWNKHVVFVRGYGVPPFGPADVADVVESAAESDGALRNQA